MPNVRGQFRVTFRERDAPVQTFDRFLDSAVIAIERLTQQTRSEAIESHRSTGIVLLEAATEEFFRLAQIGGSPFHRLQRKAILRRGQTEGDELRISRQSRCLLEALDCR